MRNDISRRWFVLLAASVALAGLVPRAAAAMSVDQARSLVDRLIADINSIINSGRPEQAMLADFEKIFDTYADGRYIAASALGPRGKQASDAQKDAFARAYRRYLAQKYGRRFREFIGGKIEVTGARPLKNFFEVESVAKLKGQAPFEVRWHVFDKSGQPKFFNLIIEGVNMLASERAEVGALLDRQGGDIDKLIAVLNG